MPQSSWASIVARIQAQMQTIANIGLVHDRDRLAVEANDIENTLFWDDAGTRRLRVWTIRLRDMPTRPAAAHSEAEWIRHVEIEGFLQFDDAAASETTTKTLAESVIRTLWSDAQTTKLNNTILFAKPPRIEDTEPKRFAAVLCSYVRLVMEIHTYET